MKRNNTSLRNEPIRLVIFLMLFAFVAVEWTTESIGDEAQPSPANITISMSNSPMSSVAEVISSVAKKEVAIPLWSGRPISYRTPKPSTQDEVVQGLSDVLASNGWHVITLGECCMKFVKGAETNGLADIPRVVVRCDGDSVFLGDDEVQPEDISETLKAAVTAETEVWVYDRGKVVRGIRHQFLGTNVQLNILPRITKAVRSDRVYKVYSPEK